MIREIFPSSFILPVMGVTDGYPNYFSKFDYSDELTNRWVEKSKALHEAIQVDWNTNYLHFDPEVEVIAETVNNMGFYHLVDVPHTNIQTTNADTFETVYTPTYLVDTEFIALNTNACYTGNTGLLNQLLDPGL